MQGFLKKKKTSVTDKFIAWGPDPDQETSKQTSLGRDNMITSGCVTWRNTKSVTFQWLIRSSNYWWKHVLSEYNGSCYVMWHNLTLNCVSRSSLGSFSGLWTLHWPQGPVSFRLPLSSPVRQQDLHVLLSPQQHCLQVLLQWHWVSNHHAGQPYNHAGWVFTQVSQLIREETIILNAASY